MKQKLVGSEVAAEALGMTHEEFLTAADNGYFPRVLMLKFGSIIKYDLDGLIEYGRTGCIPINVKTFTGRAILHRLLALESYLYGLWESFDYSPLNDHDSNPLEEFISQIKSFCELLSGVESEIENLNLFEDSNTSKKDRFDLEERIDELTNSILDISKSISARNSELSFAASGLTDFIEDLRCIDKIRDISALQFFDDLNLATADGNSFDGYVDIDEVIDTWGDDFIHEYLGLVERHAPKGST